LTRTIWENVIQLRSAVVNFYLLREGKRAFLIDGGFVGALGELGRLLREVGLSWRSIDAVFLTHGHLDHTYNIQAIKALSGATVYGHPDDRLHYAGVYPYRGLCRACGAIEQAGRVVFGYNPVILDRPVDDGDAIDLWGGLRVVHLPGHTAGHCGFYSERHRLVFSGDLVATYPKRTDHSWAWLNTCPEHFEESVDKILALRPAYLLANHCDRAGASEQWERFSHAFRSPAASGLLR